MTTNHDKSDAINVSGLAGVNVILGILSYLLQGRATPFCNEAAGEGLGD